MGLRVSIKVIPNSSKNILSREGSDYRLKITAPPVDGKANAFLIKYFSKRLKVAKSAIRIVRGETSRQKILEFDDVSEELWDSLFSKE